MSCQWAIHPLIDGTATDFSARGLKNRGAGSAYDLGDGKSAYLSQGSLKATVVPEPTTIFFFLVGLGSLAAHRRR